MTITQNVASKLVVSFVAVSMLFSLSFSPAQAATAEELQAQINALLAQINALQGGMGGSSSCSASFTMDLTIGASGASVTALQNFLIGEGHAIAAGATGYFGAQTQGALASFQAANGISPAAGYFGPITRAKVNSMCSMSDDDSNDDDSNDDDDSVSLSGEASLDSVDLSDGDDTDIEEGQEDAPVAEIEVEFADGDAIINRIDLEFLAPGSKEDPWDTFEDVSLWVDDEEVARETADDEDEYLDEDEGTLRFSGLDIVAEEDEKLTIVVAVTVQNGVDDVPATWNVGVNAIRYTDADDVVTTDDSTGDIDDAPSSVTVDFDIDEEGGDDELTVRSSDEDPDSTTLKLEDDGKSDWLEVFAFELDTDDSTNDITINDFPIQFNFSSSTASTYINDVRVIVDGETYDDWSVGSGSASSTYTFDTDGDLVIDAGDSVVAMVEVEFKELAAGNEGVTFSATTTAADYDAEGADDLTGGQLSGSRTSETHTLRTSGVTISDFDWTVGSKGTLIDFTFTIAAEDGDFTINADTGIATSTSGSATTSNGVLSVLGDDSDVTGSAPSFTVEEGGEATFRLRFTVSGTDGQTSEVEISTVGGQEVPSADQTSPTAVLDLN